MALSLLSYRMRVYISINISCIASESTLSIMPLSTDLYNHICECCSVKWGKSNSIFHVFKAKLWTGMLFQSSKENLLWVLLRDKGSSWPPVVRLGNGFSNNCKTPWLPITQTHIHMQYTYRNQYVKLHVFYVVATEKGHTIQSVKTK